MSSDSLAGDATPIGIILAGITPSLTLVEADL